MKKLLIAITAAIVFLLPNVNYGQAPTLGTAANFVLYSSVGAVTNTGISQITGNVGTNSGSSTGFGNVNGQMHDNDLASGACAADLLIAYGQLNSAIPTFFPSVTLGNGDTLIAGVYFVSAAATMGGNLILNAQGNPGAVFIFQIQGALSIAALTKVKLINGAQACNVFWKVEGLVSIATGATMRGTIVAHNAAIALNALDTLEGRALSITGAVTLDGIMAYTPLGCSTPVLTGPAAPNLLSTKFYGLFSSNGPVANAGITHVTGDVGTNLGLTTGFDPLLVVGTIHPIPDPSTATCAADLTTVYNYLEALPYDIQLLYPAQFGHNLVLTPHTYLLNAATALTDSLYLNAEGNGNAVFVIQINGALSASSFSRVILINGARSKNVYWKVDGAVTIADSSVFCGTLIVNNAAILFNLGTLLNGRALTTTGAVTINGSTIIGFTAPDAGTITGDSTVCIGSSITLTDNSSSPSGTWSASNTKAIVTIGGVVTGVVAGIDTINYTVTDAFGTTITSITVTINPLPNAGTITGGNSVCMGSTLLLNDVTLGGTWGSSNTSASVLNGTVTPVTTGIDTIRYIVTNGCGIDTAIKIVSIGTLPNAGTITGGNSVCMGSTLLLNDVTPGGTWGSSNTSATVLAGTVTPVSAGIDTIRYIVTNSCGNDTAIKIITIIPLPNAGTITGGNSVCMGSTLLLSDFAAGGNWGSSNTSATVVNGLVTGVSGGVDTIIYTVANICGSATASKTITINPYVLGIMGASRVCIGSSITLADSTLGGVWGASNSNASVSGDTITGVTAGIDTIFYAIINSCGTALTSKIVTINPLPYAGIINGLSTVCLGTTITLTDTTIGGIWRSSNTMASVAGGVVSGDTVGIDTIKYIVNSFCGMDTAIKIVAIITLPYAGIISGATSVCIGSSITLTDTTPGGVWGNSNTSATVSGGVVTGVFAGLDTTRYMVSNSCGLDTAIKVITINPLPYAGTITGVSGVCLGFSITLTDTTIGGIWSKSNNMASITGGIVTGDTVGIDTIMYSVANVCGIDTARHIVAINPLPNAGYIAGDSMVCVGSSITLTNFVSGGVWSTSNTHNNVIGGIVTGITAGVDTVRYIDTNICGTAITEKSITINPMPFAGVITGVANVCVGAAISLTDTTTGGNWSSSNTSATVSGGIVNGIAFGTVTIMYSITNICGVDVANKIITNNPLPFAGSITGVANVCTGLEITLVDTVSGGIWSSSNTSATITGGLVTGVSSGTDTIRYMFTNICGVDTAIKIINVNPFPFVPVISTQAPSVMCSGTMYQNFGTAIPPPVGIVYNWSVVNAIVMATSVTGQYALISFPNTGTAQVILSDNFASYSCRSIDALTVNVQSTIAQLPTVIYFESHFVCLPSNEDYYQWGFDDVTTLDSTLLVGEINQDYLNTNPDFANKYYWVMTGQSGCNQKTYYNVPLAIMEVNKTGNTDISVYPNPAKDVLNIIINTSIEGSLQMDIISITGQKMSSVATANQKATIDVAGLPAGIYLVNCFKDGLKVANTKFIKN